jgi:hypothetical protein
MPHLCGLDSLLSTSGTSGRSNFPTATQPPWPFTFAKIGLSVQTWQAVGSLKGMNHAHSLVCYDTITRRLTPASTMPRFTDSEGTVEDVVIEYLRNVDPSTGSSVRRSYNMDGDAADILTANRECTRNLYLKAR